MNKIVFMGMSLLILLGFTTSCVSMAGNNYTASTNGAYHSVPFIFLENGVEFAIYPNGEFDFAYVGPNYRLNPYKGSRRAFSYNTGYDYDLYLQFDRYGAVIQIESVPVYYDVYGRITQAGNVIIRYMGDVVTQIGGMHIVYERNNVYLSSSGYINAYHRNFRTRPWHAYYAVPQYNIVYTRPYRENYKPTRYSYTEHQQKYANRGRSNYENGRRTFEDPATNAPRRESSSQNRRENTPTPSTNRGRNNATAPRRESTTTNPRTNTTTKKEQNTRQNNTRRNNTTPPQTSTNRRESINSQSRNTTPPATNQNNNRGRSSSGGRR